MAQYVPKTAWKVNNLAARYGLSYVGVAPTAPTFFAATRQPTRFVVRGRENEVVSRGGYDLGVLRDKLLHGSKGNGVSFLDLRDAAERQYDPLEGGVAVHHHDLLSGACSPILPRNKEAELVVVASSRQRGVNGYNALRRWGYENVVVVDMASLRAATQASHT